MLGLGLTSQHTAASLQRDYSSRFPLSHQKGSSQISRSAWQLALPLRSFLLHAQSKRSGCPFCTLGAGGRKFDHFIKMPKSGLDLFASLALATVVGGHFWSSPPILPGRSTQQFSFALELLCDGQRVCCNTELFLRGKSRSQDALAVEGGRIGLSREDQRSREKGTDFRQEENRAHLAASGL